MKKNNMYLIIFIMLIVLLFCIAIGYFINSKNNENNKKEYEEFKFFTHDELNEVQENSNGYEITIKNYYPINLYDYINEDKIYKDITIKGFNLNKVESELKIENLTRTANCIGDEIYPKITLNGKAVEEFIYESCYLKFPAQVFIIEEKYLGILYFIDENMEHTLKIYNSDGTVEYERDIIDFNAETYTFKDYEEDDASYYINEYKLIKINNSISDILVSNGNTQFCDMINGIGICEE